MWGLHDADEDKRRGQSVPIYDDGKIEVIGLESAGTAAAVNDAPLYADMYNVTSAITL